MTGRYQAYSEYKDSGVEWLDQLPSEWSLSRLKFVTSVFGRIGFRGYTTADIVDEGEGALVLSPSNVFDGKLDLNSKTYLSWEKYYESPEIIVEPDDILLVKTGSTYGKSAIVDDNSEPMTINPQMALLKKSKIPAKFLAYIMSSHLVKAIIKVSNTGSGMPTMTQENINSFPILMPPQCDAVNIANFLDHETAKIDTLIAKQEKLIALLKEKRQAVISHAVTKGLNPDTPMKDSGVEWLGEVPEHWKISKIRFDFVFDKGLTITKTNLVDKGVPCVNYGEIHSKFGFEVDPDKHHLKCVNEDYLKSNKSSLLQQGDIVFADTSEDLEGAGNFTQLTSNKKVFAGYHTIIIRCITNCEARFIAYLFDSVAFRKQIQHTVKGVKVFSITQAILKNTNVWYPNKTEQKEIAEYLDFKTRKIDILIDKAAQAIELIKERKTALISAAITGKIDVRDWQMSVNKDVGKPNEY